MKKHYLAPLFAILALVAASCSSTTLITTEPADAEVYVNGEYIGKSPVPYADSRIIFSRNAVMIKKDGYQNFHDLFTRDEEPHPGAIIGGFFFAPIWLWALEYKPEHHYKLSPANGK